ASVSTNGAGHTFFNINGSAHPSVTTTGPQLYGNAVVLQQDTSLATTSPLGNITFQATVDSETLALPHNLTIDTTSGQPAGDFGRVQFLGDVGASKPLGSLTVTAGKPLTIDTTLKAESNIQLTVAESKAMAAGDDLTINGTIISVGGAVVLQAGDNVAINQPAAITASASVTIRGDFNNNDVPAGSTILLAGTINSPVTNVFGGAGNDTINVQKTTTGVTTIDAGAGDDIVNISSTAPTSGGVVAPIGASVVVQGGAGNDQLKVDDSGDAAPNVTGQLTSTSISGLGMGVGITYAGLEQVNVLLGSGANLTFNVKSSLAATPVNVTGKGGGTVNVGDGNNLDGVLGALAVQAVQTLNLNDQSSLHAETYEITNAGVGRFGSPQVLVSYVQVAALAINAGGHDDVFNLFLPSKGQTPLTAKILIDGGVSAPGFHNKLSVIASQVPTATGFVYVAQVGGFGSADPIQIQNIQSLYMYGAVKDSNDFANDTAVPSVIIGGQNADTLHGGSGQDVIFGGGAPQGAGAPGDVLVAGGVTGSPPDPKLLDFIFAEYAPVFQAGGGVTFVVIPGNGNTTIDAGGGSAVSLSPHTFISNASTLVQIDGSIDVITWLKARFLGPQ
ncbi:MAG TPA: hypothetical protein VFU81_18560, partial [Thermomicrobiales bacterium]|nr:hypothetical protein [Thermomicrobiales bacterium]